MAKINRFSGNLLAPASAALGTERTIFGDVTQSDDLTDQFTADLLRGWAIVGPSDEPTLQDFNAMGFTLGQIHAYLHQMGVAEYNAAQEYHLGSIANVAGVLYVSLINTNVGNAPASSPAQWTNLVPAGVPGVFSGLKLSATGTSAPVTVTVNSIAVTNSLGQQKVLSGVSVTPSIAASGANGLDTGTSTVSTFYSVWVIWNEAAGTTAGLLSLSETAPTMPAGYTHKARVGWIRTDGTANKFPLRFDQYGAKVVISPLAGTNVSGNLIMASGVAGTVSGVGANVSVNNFIPSTSGVVEVFISTQSAVGGTVQVGRTGDLINSVVTSITNEANQTVSAIIALDGTSRNITYASNTSGGIVGCRGWEDNL